MRYYAFPDIHGMFNHLKRAFEFVQKENPNGCKIIFLGDYIDRGPYTIEVLDFMMNLPKNFDSIPLMGNHEQMMIGHIDGTMCNEYSRMTIRKLGHSLDNKYIQWMKKLKLFHIEDDNVFAHAYYVDGGENTENLCLWMRLSDTEGFPSINNRLHLTHGHTPRLYGPTLAPRRTNLDCGTCFGGPYAIGEYQKGVKGPVAFHRFE